MRFLTPVLFAAAAGWMAWYNGQYTDRAVVLPFVELLDPSAAGDPVKLGSLSVVVLAAIAGILAVWEGFRWMRERGSTSD